jgi:queuine tRNA-ribosyltransferase
MTAIEATNRGVADMPWAMLTTTPEVAEVDVTALASRGPDAALLDVREPEEYAHGHVPGATNLPQAELATRLEEVPRDRTVFVICQGGMRSRRVAQFLRQMAFVQVANVQGGTEAWRTAGKPLAFGDRTREKPRFVDSTWTHAGSWSLAAAAAVTDWQM